MLIGSNRFRRLMVKIWSKNNVRFRLHLVYCFTSFFISCVRFTKFYSIITRCWKWIILCTHKITFCAFYTKSIRTIFLMIVWTQCPNIIDKYCELKIIERKSFFQLSKNEVYFPNEAACISKMQLLESTHFMNATFENSLCYELFFLMAYFTFHMLTLITLTTSAKKKIMKYFACIC